MPLRRQNRFSRRRLPGFTLIEILVVVAIIALLISILLPSLNQAREQAKIIKCLANLGSLGKASSMYLDNNRNRFCWGPGYKDGIDVPVGSGTGPVNPLMRTWYLGGNRGQDSGQLQTGGFYVSGSQHDWGPAEKPLNKYAYSTSKLSPSDRRPLFKEGDLTLFRCPSDQGVRWDTNAASTLKYSVSAFLEVGSSYDSNSNWSYYAKNKEYISQPGQANRIRYLMKRIIPILTKKGASRAVLIYEDTADWALSTADSFAANYKVQSWHNKLDIHNFMFLDGHAAQLYADWRQAKFSIDKQMTSSWVIRQNFKEESN